MSITREEKIGSITVDSFRGVKVVRENMFTLEDGSAIYAPEEQYINLDQASATEENGTILLRGNFMPGDSINFTVGEGPVSITLEDALPHWGIPNALTVPDDIKVIDAGVTTDDGDYYTIVSFEKDGIKIPATGISATIAALELPDDVKQMLQSFL